MVFRDNNFVDDYVIYVVGIMIGVGVDFGVRGMANLVMFYVYDVFGDVFEMASVVSNDNLLIFNYFYGFLNGWF